jgi:hypothetical protein
MKSKRSIFFNIFVVVFGLAAMIMGIIAMQSKSASWPEVPGQIVSSEISNSNSDELSTYDSTYKYMVGSTEYSSSSNSSTERVPGEQITVYYDPDDPSTSVLSRGETELTGVIGFAFGLFCVGGVAWEVFKSKTRKNQAPAAPAEDTQSD